MWWDVVWGKACRTGVFWKVGCSDSAGHIFHSLFHSVISPLAAWSTSSATRRSFSLQLQWRKKTLLISKGEKNGSPMILIHLWCVLDADCISWLHVSHKGHWSSESDHFKWQIPHKSRVFRGGMSAVKSLIHSAVGRKPGSRLRPRSVNILFAWMPGSEKEVAHNRDA